MRQSLTKIPDGKFQGIRLGLLCGESAEGGVPFASFPRTICSTRPSRTETMIAASSVSRKTMKKMGTEKTVILSLSLLAGSDLVNTRAEVARVKEERKSMPKGGRRGGDMEEGVI